MKYKDYYAILGIERAASADEIKKAYRRLARQYHPDVSKDPEGEAKFKDLSEAYQTLKDADKRTAYDRLGQHQPGQDFRPSEEWERQFSTQFGDGEPSFEGIDLSDLFAHLARQRGAGAAGARHPVPGEDLEVSARISLEDTWRGTRVTLNLSVPAVDEHGHMRHAPRSIEARIPKGATDGQRLRLRGQGGKGHRGGRDGDLYLRIVLLSHPLYRVHGHDLYIDVPLAPWEAALGATVEVPTLAGPVSLKVAAATSSGQHLRLGKRGLPRPGGGEGDLYAVVKILTPPALSERERALFKELAEGSTFNPRSHFTTETANAK